MVTCEMCGADVSNLVEIRVAGTNMKVCGNCKNMGVLVEKKNDNVKHTFRHKKKEEDVKEEVVENYSSLLNKGLSKRKIDIHQLARAVNIKESSLQKYFTGKLHPDLQTAKRLEKFLEIKLTREVDLKETDDNSFSLETNDLNSQPTLGDLIMKQLNEKGKKE